MKPRPYVAEDGPGPPFTPEELAYMESERKRIAARVILNPADNRYEVSDEAFRRREIYELEGWR